MKKIVVLSGAGISAESGISTFRDANGLWENHRIEDVASPEGFMKNPDLVMTFYNLRRKQLQDVKPNRAHEILAELEEFYDVSIVTQNVDDLHERAGSSHIIHLHGELNKVRPINNSEKIIPWKGDLNVGDKDDEGQQLRPHIVWFGEMVPEMEKAEKVVAKADFLIIIGTSMQVYPAAGLVHNIPKHCQIFVIDPNLENHYTTNENFLSTTAVEGMKILKEKLLAIL